ICLYKGKYDIPNEEKLTALAMRILQRKVARKWRKARQELNLRDGLAQEQNSRAESADGAAQAPDNGDLIHRLLRCMNKTEELEQLKARPQLLKSFVRFTRLPINL